MPQEANKIRGETPLKFGDDEIIISSCMENLAKYVDVVGDLDFEQVSSKLRDIKEHKFVGSVLQALCIDGDAKKAWSNARGFGDFSQAYAGIMTTIFPQDDEGNSEAEAEEND
ncbi:hypothetical protein [Cohaesibacter gelatinilyticus]|uniref:Uncharacterized protein n=1 Tax=Cohaesibacter gelatinilyticus TaxID=372072 RepID=A0A285PKC8_9HYPH|nr:hypothetical protein [Cohaesibacter gelatinilyticus]SNZ21727.1 hypothetical protein SAMN06265368_4852 [Cohaesibacter gelatinilyticus]